MVKAPCTSGVQPCNSALFDLGLLHNMNGIGDTALGTQ
jgi:hypothetical protein